MFTPKWKSDAKYLVKGARKFLQYKLDLLKPDQIGEIESRREDLIAAIKSGDRKKVDEAAKYLRATCDDALPHQKPTNWLEENVEVMFVAIVIALGLRAYYLQPFRIPTGSMQPTLNGIVGTSIEKDQWPALPKRIWEKAMRGRSYVKVEADEDLKLRIHNRMDGLHTEMGDTQYMHFFSRSVIKTVDGKLIRMPAPSNPIYSAGLRAALENAAQNGIINGNIVTIPKGTILCEGYIDTGDLVLVNKFAYHFRKPERGEVFVFDTLGIKGIDAHTGPQGKGSHYIKRLCGVPGDTLEIQQPYLLIDGKIAQEPGIQRVANAEGVYALSEKAKQQGDKVGYHTTGSNQPSYFETLTKPGDTLKLRDNTRPGMREYAALGDNTNNSLDSRYWGTVKEYNLVGPALFSLWPITTGHWGFIK